MLHFADSLLNLSAQAAACNRFHSMEQRFARWLLIAHTRHCAGADIMPMTHEFLSSMLGVRRASVTETAGEFQRTGLISYYRGQLTITDRDGLEAIACEGLPARPRAPRLPAAAADRQVAPPGSSSFRADAPRLRAETVSDEAAEQRGPRSAGRNARNSAPTTTAIERGAGRQHPSNAKF
jgi:hypothetical protein